MTQAGPDRPWMGPLPAVGGCDCHICRPDEFYDDADRATIETVLAHGWQVVLVSDEASCEHPDHDDAEHHAHPVHDHQGHEVDDSVPAFAYTVGLGHRCGHPELLISGLDPTLMHRVLNDVARRVMLGRRLVPGDVLEDVLAGVPVVLEQVTDEGLADTVTWSGWFHRTRPEALAIVWPTTSGLFAWQPGAPETLDRAQPPSWRARFPHSGGVGVDPDWVFPVPPDHPTFSCSHVVDGGDAILWAARQTDETRGEDWSIHCGAEGHETDDMRLVHLAHLVRSAPSLRELGDLGLDEEALRLDPDSAWARGPLI